MKLIGMLDSPYVRRVAISLQLLGLRFEHDPLSVFQTFDEFQKINPVVKAPSFVCDDGQVLMDSTLILEYAEALACPQTLVPSGLSDLQTAIRITGLALAACEKSVQIIYERGQRPVEKIHEPWLTRVSTQLLAAYGELEEELGRQPLPVTSADIDQAGVSTAVAWHFTQRVIPEVVPIENYPLLAAYSAKAEALPEFKAAAYGSGTYPNSN